jgi:nicotinate-nucleotide pyrophosphorylase (carboxylating)
MSFDCEVEALLDRVISEDLATGDPTTEILIPSDLQGTGMIFTEEPGVLCGGEIAISAFRRVEPALEVKLFLGEGTRMGARDIIARVDGPMAGIIRGERLVLNIIQHLSGISTEVARYVEAVADLSVRIVDTRKTIPGLRALEKYAVRIGGGHNHRCSLGDGVLVKDNHIAALRGTGLTFGQVVKLALDGAPRNLTVEVEVTNLVEAEEAIAAGAQFLLLDNMALEEVRGVVQVAQGRAVLEASGGVTLETIHAVAETGVDFISVGALTHSVKALDVSMDVKAD